MIDKADELSRGDYLCVYRGSGTYDQVSVDVIETMLGDGTAWLVYQNADFQVYRVSKLRKISPDNEHPDWSHLPREHGKD